MYKPTPEFLSYCHEMLETKNNTNLHKILHSYVFDQYYRECGAVTYRIATGTKDSELDNCIKDCNYVFECTNCYIAIAKNAISSCQKNLKVV